MVLPTSTRANANADSVNGTMCDNTAQTSQNASPHRGSQSRSSIGLPCPAQMRTEWGFLTASFAQSELTSGWFSGPAQCSDSQPMVHVAAVSARGSHQCVTSPAVSSPPDTIDSGHRSADTVWAVNLVALQPSQTRLPTSSRCLRGHSVEPRHPSQRWTKTGATGRLRTLSVPQMRSRRRLSPRREVH